MRNALLLTVQYCRFREDEEKKSDIFTVICSEATAR